MNGRGMHVHEGGAMENASGQLADRYLAMVVDDSPTLATFLGLHTNDASLGDLSTEAAEERRRGRAYLCLGRHL